MTEMMKELPGMERVTTADILAVLKAHYDGSVYRGTPEWIGIEEMRAGAGYSRGRPGSERRIDYFAIHQYPSKDHHRIAFEIKVSRGDWLKELREPVKRRMGLLFSNEFYYVCPPGLIKEDEIPPECGLIECHPNKKHREQLQIIRRAPWRDTLPPTWSLFVSVIRKERERSNVD